MTRGHRVADELENVKAALVNQWGKTLRSYHDWPDQATITRLGCSSMSQMASDQKGRTKIDWQMLVIADVGEGRQTQFLGYLDMEH
jgi:hypothetical protein